MIKRERLPTDIRKRLPRLGPRSESSRSEPLPDRGALAAWTWDALEHRFLERYQELGHRPALSAFHNHSIPGTAFRP